MFFSQTILMSLFLSLNDSQELFLFLCIYQKGTQQSPTIYPQKWFMDRIEELQSTFAIVHIVSLNFWMEIFNVNKY